MATISQTLTDALNQAETDHAAAVAAQQQAVASASQAQSDASAAASAQATAASSFAAALQAVYTEFGVSPPAPAA